MTKTDKAPVKKKAQPKGREGIFADANKDLTKLSAKYKGLAITQSGGSAQRLNKASIELARLAKLFV